MYFLIEDDGLLEKYNVIWDKVSTGIKKEFDTKPVYTKKFLKTKTKSYGNDKEMSKVGFNYTCLAVIIDRRFFS